MIQIDELQPLLLFPGFLNLLFLNVDHFIYLLLLVFAEAPDRRVVLDLVLQLVVGPRTEAAAFSSESRQLPGLG